MVAISEDLAGLVNLPIITKNNDHPYPLYVSTQTPWNNLGIQIRMFDNDLDAVDEVIGAWYTEGFHGAFGEKEWGRFHEISHSTALSRQWRFLLCRLWKSQQQCCRGFVTTF